MCIAEWDSEAPKGGSPPADPPYKIMYLFLIFQRPNDLICRYLTKLDNRFDFVNLELSSVDTGDTRNPRGSSGAL